MPVREGGGPRLRAEALACRRGGRAIFSGLSFELWPGQALELRGANGSGKTSLLRLLAGLTPAAAGSLCWDGQPLRPGDPTHRQDFAYLGHHNALSAELTALENLRFAQQLGGGPGDATALQQALQTWDMAPRAIQPLRRLSQGQQRRVALARVGLGRRRLWLLDEPCAGLDEAGERLFDARLAEHLAGGGLAVVATHQALRLPSEARCLLALPASPRQPAPAAC